MTRKSKVAIVQAEAAPDLDEGLERTRRLALDAAASGAELIIFPETWIPGYPAWLDHCRDAALWDHPPVKRAYARMAANSISVPGPAFDELAGVAQSSGATLVLGISERVEEGPGRGTLFNSLVAIGSDGRLLNHHRKLMPTYTEKLVWGAGDVEGLRAVNTAAGRVGGLICWEHWMPLARHALHRSGEDIHVAVWPSVHEMHQVASRHYAFEGRCYVLASGALMRRTSIPLGLELHPDRTEPHGGLLLRGGSAIIGPDGCYIAGPVYDEETILMAELDLGRIREENMTLDVAGHYDRAELFKFGLVANSRDCTAELPAAEV